MSAIESPNCYHWALVLGLAIAGTVITQLLTYRHLPVSEAFRSENWESPWIAGGVAGATVGHFLWVVAQPRRRLSRAAAICALANVLVWCSFLAFGPRFDDPEFSRLRMDRAERQAEFGHLVLVTDQPILVAGRWHGTFGALNFADRLLTLFAAPAIGFAELMVLPSDYQIDAMKRESLAIAWIGFVLSTVFWVAFGGGISALRRVYRRRATTR